MATISARVYVWYPHGDDIGHASMHIGPDWQSGDTVNYVSWWPDHTNDTLDLLPGRKSGGECRSMAQDAKSEGGKPHVSFQLYDLDVGAMAKEWALIKGKNQAHYRLMRKNCATIVARVLRAGGAATWAAKGILPSWDAHRVYWTPKLVAKLCSGICENGHGQEFDHKRTDKKDENRVFQALRMV